jgi:hypothetical protein
MTSRNRLALTLTCLLLLAPALGAQQDLSGLWDMETNASLPGDEGPPCVFEGTCQMSQEGSSLQGTVVLTLISGPQSCPPEMTAGVGGLVEGNHVAGTVSGQLGEVDFSGDRTNPFLGEFEATAGPFAGSTGSWIAGRSELAAIPSAGAVGLALLVALLMGAGIWLLRWQTPA